MNYNPLNIVFFPHSANFGLAGTNRLQNIIYYLKKENVNLISNIALEDKAKLFNKDSEDLFIIAYREIYYGPSIFAFIRHIFQACWHLLKSKKSNSKNIIYFYGEIDIKNFFFVIWARMIGFKVVIDIVEDLETITKFKSFKNKVKYKSAVFFRKRLHLFADGFIVVSTHLSGKITNNFPNIPLFFLPVTVNKYLLSAKVNRKTDQLTTLFYSGSFNEKDGLPYLLEGLFKVMEGGKTFKLILSGKGSDKEMKKFWNDVDKFKLHAQIEYKGYLNRTQYVETLSREVDVLCMTRVNSAFANAGFPFKLGEFLATGKPVIASKVGDVEKYLSNTDAYLVEPENAEQIKEALLKIINNKEAAKIRGLNGQQAAMKYFDHENYALGIKNFMLEKI